FPRPASSTPPAGRSISSRCSPFPSLLRLERHKAALAASRIDELVAGDLKRLRQPHHFPRGELLRIDPAKPQIGKCKFAGGFVAIPGSNDGVRVIDDFQHPDRPTPA